MAIGTDVQRIKGNIAAALSAIAEKGVTVPDGSNSDALAGLIASIEAGGGGLLFGQPYATGSFTVAEDITSTYTVCTIPDSLITNVNKNEAFIGTVLIWCTKSPSANLNIKSLDIAAYSYSIVGNAKSIFNVSAFATDAIGYGNGTIEFNGKDMQIRLSSTRFLAAGRNYNWLYMPFVY